MRFLSIYLILLFSIQISMGQQSVEELGKVKWLRNLDQAKKEAAQKKLPIFLLFQEVPGCATCRNFGNDVLSHPLIVEAIQTYFVPLAIYNNKGGHDAEVLNLYKEPAWNNPVFRFIDETGKDILPRHSGQYSGASVVKAINTALTKSNRLIPGYLSLLETELNAHTDELYLEMYCFWSGEKNIGSQPGVVYTEPGYSNGKEVVKVVFDQNLTSADKIVASARKSGNADAIHEKSGHKTKAGDDIKSLPLKNYSIDKDLHYYLKNSVYANLPLTPMQATKINSAIGSGTNPSIYLSPLQLKMLEEINLGKLPKKIRYTASPWYSSWPANF